MGWEYRVFQRLEDQPSTANPNKNKPSTTRPRQGRERMVDRYLVVSPRLGVKLRQGGWEVKVRTGQSSLLEGLERWSKERVGSREALTRVLEARVGEDERQALSRWREVVVEKERTRAWRDGLLVEETEVRVEGREERWRTWSIEGEERRVVEWVEGRKGEWEGCLVMGYPQWLVSLSCDA